MVLVILLTTYALSNQQGFVTQERREETLRTVAKTQVARVPLQVSVSTDKYYITGYPEEINPTLEELSALITSTINAQSLRVYIDLGHLRIGEHMVPVKINGLSTQLTYSVNPSKVCVNI